MAIITVTNPLVFFTLMFQKGEKGKFAKKQSSSRKRQPGNERSDCGEQIGTPCANLIAVSALMQNLPKKKKCL